MEEIWKDIPGYEGYYQASDLGQVKSLDRIVTEKGTRGAVKQYTERIIFPTISQDYFYYTLSKNGIAKRYRAHIIIAKMFVPNPFHYPEVNHKDENKRNNEATNLEWCTNIYNINYGTGIRRRSKSQKGSIRLSECGEKNHNSKLTENQVKSIFTDIRILKEIAKEYNVSIATCSRIKKNQSWKYLLITN